MKASRIRSSSAAKKKKPTGTTPWAAIAWEGYRESQWNSSIRGVKTSSTVTPSTSSITHGEK